MPKHFFRVSIHFIYRLAFSISKLCTVTSNYRSNRVVSAVISEGNPVSSTSSGADVFKLTYLEVGFVLFFGFFLFVLFG